MLAFRDSVSPSLSTTRAASRLPSVERLLRAAELAPALAAFGRPLVVAALREALAERRATLRAGGLPDAAPAALAAEVEAFCRARLAIGPRPVFNLTGTVLHTNLGRAPLAAEAVAAMTAAAAACDLEFDLERGRRGERDGAVAARLRRLTGAEDALVVNNNAAALLLLLNTLALRREVPVSRGELIEIGGSFRLPEIMARAGCRLVEVGTTNRTHAGDFAEAISPRTGLLLKVHCSNYAIAGFTAAVALPEMKRLAAGNGLPLAVDLGSGTLLDLARWGLPAEPSAASVLAAGADLVAFSGDKLLGGPQAGLVAGRADLVRRLARNPLKRALRADKLTLAALDATLALYEDPDRLASRLPALRLLVRPAEEIAAQARRLAGPVQAALGGGFTVAAGAMASQIGSGALPTATLASAGLAIRPAQRGRGADARLRRLARALRGLPRPVIGAIGDGALRLDLRGLDDEARFLAQLARLRRRPAP